MDDLSYEKMIEEVDKLTDQIKERIIAYQSVIPAQLLIDRLSYVLVNLSFSSAPSPRQAGDFLKDCLEAAIENWMKENN